MQGLFCWVLLFVVCVGSGTGMVDGANDRPDNDLVSTQKVYTLDLRNRSLTHLVERGAAKEGYKFVQFEVISVDNPSKYPLIFQVDFRDSVSGSSHLGSFALYPSDNPGRFIVPTQNKIKDGGSIVVTMAFPEKAQPSDRLTVTIKEPKLIKGP